jgi:hypothetical protein
MWLKDLEIYLTQNLHNGIPILFIGNKADKSRQVTLPNNRYSSPLPQVSSRYSRRRKGSMNKMRSHGVAESVTMYKWNGWRL